MIHLLLVVFYSRKKTQFQFRASSILSNAHSHAIKQKHCIDKFQNREEFGNMGLLAKISPYQMYVVFIWNFCNTHNLKGISFHYYKRQNLGEHQWPHVLFTGESMFSLTLDCKRVYIWMKSRTQNRLSNIMERDHFGMLM